MDILGPTGTYMLIVALAAFAVGVHSYSMYGQRVPVERDSPVRDPLNALALPTVAGQNAFRRGFAAYLIANEMLYILLISSSIILELSLNAIGKAELVGALSSENPLNSIVPILASTVVITASQLRPFSRIEHSIRSVAHRIAGIPRNLDSVQEQIRLTSIEEIEQSLQSDASKSDTTGNSRRLIGNAREQAREVYNSAKGAGLGEFDASNLNNSLVRVHCLYEWTLGYDGEQIWISDDVKQITTLFDSLKLEFRTFKSSVGRLKGETPSPSGDTPASRIELWEKVVSDSLMLERRLTVVLSLLLINKPDVELQKYDALAFLRDKTVDEEIGVDKVARNALGISVLFGSFTAFICMISYLSLEKTFRDWGQVQAAELLTKAPFGQPAVSNDASYWLQYFSNRMDNAFFETLDFTLIFSVSLWIALIMRDALLVQKRWPKMQPGDIAPVGTYLYIGMIAYLPSMLLFLVLKFMVLMIISPLRSGAEMLDPLSLKTFPGYLPGIVLVPIMSFVCVWFICNYLDQKLYERKRSAPTALKYAAVCGGLNFLLATLRGGDMDLDDAIAAFAIPSIVIYALFLVFCRVYRRQYLMACQEKVGAKEPLEAFLAFLNKRVYKPVMRSINGEREKSPPETETS